MVENEFKEFDLQIRSMMENAEEEVPSRVWDAIDSRLPRKNPVFAPAWLKYSGIAFAAVAAILLTLTITGTFSRSTIDIAPASRDEARIAQVEIAEVAEIAEITEIAEPEQIAKFVAAKPVETETVRETAKPAETVESVGSVEVTEEPAAETATEPKETAVEIKDLTKEQWDAYFGEEPAAKKNAGKAVIDFSGILGSNDGVSQKSILSTAWSAPVKGTTYKTGVSETSTSVYGIPVTFGISARFYVTDKLSIGTGLNYSLLTRSFTGDYIEADENGAKTMSVQGANIVNRQNYIGIPVNLYYDFLQTDLIDFYGFAGGTVEKGLSNTYSISAEDVYEKFNAGITGVQASAAAGLGIQFKISRDWGIFIDPSARYYFDCKQPTSVRTAKPFMFNFEVGARININNR